MEKEYGPQTPVAKQTHAEKHRVAGEEFRDYANRVADTLADSEAYFRPLRDILGYQRFLPAGRVQAAIGTTKYVTPYNCYVSGRIEDNFVGEGGIMQRATESAQTMRMGGGIGYDFSTLRPRNDLIVSLDSRASGPISFMEIYDAVCATVASAGHRRGAQMGVLRVDHPDIEEFIHAKQNDNRLTNFNISVAVTDEFMRAVENDDSFDLKFKGRVYKTIQARPLWDQIMRSTYDWAEPGVLFIDRINEMNNLWYCEDICATNPCGEQPLPPFGACLLGSFNLPKYIGLDEYHHHYFNYNLFRHDIVQVVRAMDNVVDVAHYPLPEQEKEAKSKRRMGLGVTGSANAIECLGFPYGSPGFLEQLGDVLRVLRDTAYKTSVSLAGEKGSFPLFQADEYLAGSFIRTLSEDIRDGIRSIGIRNSHLLSIAPTGTISLCADNVASGIEPVFASSLRRTIITDGGDAKQYDLMDWGYANGIQGKLSRDVRPDEHVAVLAVAQRYVDSAVSKTCNVPHDIPWEGFKNVYMAAWKAGAKGCTTYREGAGRGAVLVSNDTVPERSEGAACTIDPESGMRSCE